MSHSRKKLDLTGQQFGALTVVAPAESVGGHTAWRCRCACGEETTVRTCHLRAGHTRSCGCANVAGVGKYLSYIDGENLEPAQSNTIRKNNTSGVPGVDWRNTKQRWRASICFQGRRYYLGSFRNFQDAVNARKKAEAELHEKLLVEFAGASCSG